MLVTTTTKSETERPSTATKSISILHVLDHFVPISSGYTFRSRYMLDSQRRILGVRPVVLTSPQHESDAADGQDWQGIPVYRTPVNARGLRAIPVFKEVLNMVRLKRRIMEVARRENVQAIHAHSPVLNAWPALFAGAALGIPVIYEIRAFWEDAAVMHGTTRQDSLRYRITRFIETQACRRMDAVVTICNGLKQQLLARNIRDKDVFVLPNGVDPRKFQPGADRSGVRDRLGLQSAQVIGFIGSLYRYEGLHVLVEALAALALHFPGLRGLIVGEGFGSEERELKDLAAKLGVSDRLIFTGKVPHEEVLDYYAAIDILAYPRVRSRLLELVTPLKILEALALSKAVIGSDVGGIKEIIEDGSNGRLFRADEAGHLAEVAASMLEDAGELSRLGSNGRRYVLEHRNWDTLIESHRRAYHHIGLLV